MFFVIFGQNLQQSQPFMDLGKQKALIFHHFPHLTPFQRKQFDALEALYCTWNHKVNLISRKDIHHLYLRHILHGLSIAKVVQFKAGTQILDLGTGGGLPGIPLAILFPAVHFVLVDSIGKKVHAAADIARHVGLKNVTTLHMRAEAVEGSYDFVVSRAVGPLPRLYGWIRDKIKPKSQHPIPNGLLYLQGGTLETNELDDMGLQHRCYPIRHFFQAPFFETKNVVHLFSP